MKLPMQLGDVLYMNKTNLLLTKGKAFIMRGRKYCMVGPGYVNRNRNIGEEVYATYNI